MSEIRKISIDLNEDLLKSVAKFNKYEVIERDKEIIFKRNDLYRNMSYKNGELIYDDMNEKQKNDLIAQTYKEQIKCELIRNNITDFIISEDAEQITIMIGREK